MTRQIALGAIIAFALTVLALSIWEPKATPTPPPEPTPPAPLAQPLAPTMRATIKVRPEAIRDGTLQLSPRAAAVAAALDAGIP